MRKTHSTNEKNIDLNREYYTVGLSNFKPVGLWYSINEEWEEWIDCNMPEWKKENIFELSIDMDSILIINNFKELEQFIAKYSMNECGIKWHILKEEYKGIEICNYWEVKSATMRVYNRAYSWFWGLDCSGGCIWDLTAIKEYKNQLVTI